MSVELTDGGPAFPVADDVCQVRRAEGTEVLSGMSLRDWFAGQALSAIVAYAPRQSAEVGPVFLSKEAYALADAMLKERVKSE